MASNRKCFRRKGETGRGDREGKLLVERGNKTERIVSCGRRREMGDEIA